MMARVRTDEFRTPYDARTAWTTARILVIMATFFFSTLAAADADCDAVFHSGRECLFGTGLPAGRARVDIGGAVGFREREREMHTQKRRQTQMRAGCACSDNVNIYVVEEEHIEEASTTKKIEMRRKI